MKIKNILKTGILSMLLLSFLLSPFLKFNNPTVKALECGGICTNKKCEELGPTYKEAGSQFTCPDRDQKCCVSSQAPDSECSEAGGTCKLECDKKIEFQKNLKCQTSGLVCCMPTECSQSDGLCRQECFADSEKTTKELSCGDNNNVCCLPSNCKTKGGQCRYDNCSNNEIIAPSDWFCGDNAICCIKNPDKLSECERNEGTCRQPWDYSDTAQYGGHAGCPTGEQRTNWSCDNENLICCTKQDAVLEPGERYDELKYYEDVIGTAKESNAAKICDALYPSGSGSFVKAWVFPSEQNDDTWWHHKTCLIQIGVLEGVGKFIAGMINTLTANILWALRPSTYGGFVGNEGIKIIWTQLRNFMNLVLILVLVIIAIATILGIKKYNWKSLLWKLIVIALLINFSLVIPGILLDISHFTTYVFINLAQKHGEESNIAQEIMRLYRTNDISSYKKYELSYDDQERVTKNIDGSDIKIAKTGWGLYWGNFFLVLAGLGIVGLFAFISLVAVFFTMIIRGLLIIILIAVSPIAFVAWILPNTERYWNMWWEQLTRWCIFPVVFAVSLYAGVVMFNHQNAALAELGASNEKLGIFAMILQIVLFSMFLVAGLMVSVQSSGAAGKFVQKQVSRAGWLAGAFTAIKTKKAIEGTNLYRQAGEALTKAPALSSIGYKMIDQSDAARKDKDIKKRKKELEESRTKDEIVNMVSKKAPSKLNKKAYTDYMAGLNLAIEKGWIDPIKNTAAMNQIKKFVADGNPDLNMNAVLKAFPQCFAKNLAGKVEEFTADNVSQIVKNLSALKPGEMPQNTENILKVIKEADGDINEFLEKLAFLKTNQIKAFFDNVDEGESNIGTVFNGKIGDEKPWTGIDSEIAKALRQREVDTRNKYNRLDAAYRLNSSPTPQDKADLDDALNAWIHAQAAIDQINNKLATSSSLEESLGIKNV